MTFGYERNDLMNTVGLSGEDKLELGALILQASELIKIFIGKYYGFCYLIHDGMSSPA
jgi:hypothetical protein